MNKIGTRWQIKQRVNDQTEVNVQNDDGILIHVLRRLGIRGMLLARTWPHQFDRLLCWRSADQMFAAENRPSAPSRAAALVVLRRAAALSRAPLGSGAVVQPVLLTIRNWTPTESNIRTHQTHLIRKFKSVWRALTELPDKLIPSWLKIIQQSRRIWRQSLKKKKKKKKKHPAEQQKIEKETDTNG